MMTRRRLSLQLTPLLDLLLIVMFSQYIENRSRSAQAAEELRLEKAAVQEELTRERAQLEDLRRNHETQYRSLLQQHQNIGTLLNQTLDLPATALAEVLKLRNDNRPADADRLQQALTTLRSQLDQNPDALFRFFIRFDEMQKHVSLWEIHLQQNGKCRLQDGQQSLEVEFSSETELAEKLFEASKSLEDPHSLVLLLVTWGDAQLGAQQKTRRAVTLLRDLLKRDSENRQIYDYVVLGFRPTGPVIHPQQPPTTPPR